MLIFVASIQARHIDNKEIVIASLMCRIVGKQIDTEELDVNPLIKKKNSYLL